MKNFKPRLFIFVCLFLSGLSAKADFNFKCLELTKESDCIRQFKERDKLGFFKDDGTEDKTLGQTPSAFCGVTAANTTCAVAPGTNLMMCAVKSKNCSPVSAIQGTFVCEKGSGHRGVTTKRMKKDPYGHEHVLVEFFCVPKNTNPQSQDGAAGGTAAPVDI